jgi:hypothetical protein
MPNLFLSGLNWKPLIFQDSQVYYVLKFLSQLSHFHYYHVGSTLRFDLTEQLNTQLTIAIAAESAPQWQVPLRVHRELDF